MSDYEVAYGYNEYGDYNRFSNLDSIEGLIITHLLKSHSVYAENFWRLLKYADIDALNKTAVSESDRADLICNPGDNNVTERNVFCIPFSDDIFENQVSAVFIYVDNIYPVNRMQANVEVTVEVITHAKLSLVRGNYTAEDGNPNDMGTDNNPVVTLKNRETALVKCLLAELNGLYINGIGYLSFDAENGLPGRAQLDLYTKRSFYGHTITFVVKMGNISNDAEIGF